MKQPWEGEVLAGWVGVKVTVVDDVAVTRVDYYIDGNGIGYGTVAPEFRKPWNSINVPNGQHTVYGVATDSAGRVFSSPVVTFTVQNDSTPPLTPTNLAVSNVSTSGATLSWAASSDNVGVKGYRLFRNGAQVATTTALTYSFGGLSCGTSYTLGVAAYDSAGNVSAIASTTVSTLACSGDTTAPSAPANAAVSGATQTSLTLSWSASTDNVGVAGYRLFKNGVQVATTTALSYTFGGLSCGTGYTLGVAAYDAAGNVSAISTSSGTTASCPSSGQICGTAATPPASWQHVVWIVFENRSYANIIGNSSAPYLNSVASKCGLATQFYAETHPSLPNYIAMTSGSTQGITDDNGPSSHPLNVPSIFSQLGAGWKALQESMPSNCYLSNSGSYAVRHNPATYYTNIRTQCAAQDVPLGSTPDISARFTFITPNMCHDMHDCSVSTGDTWFSGFLPKLLASPQWQAGTTVIVITWDEDDRSASNHIVTIVVSPSTPAGLQVSTRYDHYALLRTTEELLGLGLLGNATMAPSMATAFRLR